MDVATDLPQMSEKGAYDFSELKVIQKSTDY